MATYLITGGTGFIGSELIPALSAEGHSLIVFTRNIAGRRSLFSDSVRLIDSFSLIASSERIDGIINLAGEGIADRRWSDRRKQVLIDSRIGPTHGLSELVSRLNTKPDVMISGSAIGYYGSQGTRILDESSPPEAEFTHEICHLWESAAQAVGSYGVRLCIVRLGLVLGKKGGLLKRLLPPFYLGMGGKIGEGSQIMSWVHLRDVVRGIRFLMENPATGGVYNLSAPAPVSNLEFTQELGHVLHRPTLLPLPAVLVKAVFGEMGERLLLGGQHVTPARLLETGFEFEFATLRKALLDIFRNRVGKSRK